MSMSELNDGNLPSDLEFFSGGERNGEKLFKNVAKNVGIIIRSNQKFLEFLTSKFGANLLMKNKMQIHLETGQIFYDNKIMGESLYDFLKKQEDLNKKELKVDVPIDDDFDYVREILSNVKDDLFDMNSNSTSKFLFYNFDTFRSLHGKEILTIRNSIVANDEYALEILQNRKWLHFIKNLIYISNGDLSLDLFQDEYNEENSLIDQTFENSNYCKNFYRNVFDDIAYFFHEKLKETPDTFIEKWKKILHVKFFIIRKSKNKKTPLKFCKNLINFFSKQEGFLVQTIWQLYHLV